MFLTINLHFVASNQIFTYRKLNLPLTSSIYFVFLPLHMQKRLKQTKVYYTLFHFVWKEMSHKTFKVAAVITLSSGVYIIGATWFNKGFLSYLITGKR